MPRKGDLTFTEEHKQHFFAVYDALPDPKPSLPVFLNVNLANDPLRPSPGIGHKWLGERAKEEGKKEAKRERDERRKRELVELWKIRPAGQGLNAFIRANKEKDCLVDRTTEAARSSYVRRELQAANLVEKKAKTAPELKEEFFRHWDHAREPGETLKDFAKRNEKEDWCPKESTGRNWIKARERAAEDPGVDYDELYTCDEPDCDGICFTRSAYERHKKFHETFEGWDTTWSCREVNCGVIVAMKKSKSQHIQLCKREEDKYDMVHLTDEEIADYKRVLMMFRARLFSSGARSISEDTGEDFELFWLGLKTSGLTHFASTSFPELLDDFDIDNATLDDVPNDLQAGVRKVVARLQNPRPDATGLVTEQLAELLTMQYNQIALSGRDPIRKRLHPIDVNGNRMDKNDDDVTMKDLSDVEEPVQRNRKRKRSSVELEQNQTKAVKTKHTPSTISTVNSPANAPQSTTRASRLAKDATAQKVDRINENAIIDLTEIDDLTEIVDLTESTEVTKNSRHATQKSKENFETPNTTHPPPETIPRKKDPLKKIGKQTVKSGHTTRANSHSGQTVSLSDITARQNDVPMMSPSMKNGKNSNLPAAKTASTTTSSGAAAQTTFRLPRSQPQNLPVAKTASTTTSSGAPAQTTFRLPRSQPQTPPPSNAKPSSSNTQLKATNSVKHKNGGLKLAASTSSPAMPKERTAASAMKMISGREDETGEKTIRAKNTSRQE